MSIFRDIGESLGNAVLENVGRAVGRAQERTPLPVDLLESEDAYLAVFDAPGATSTDVQVQYADGAVEVRIDRFREFYQDFDMRYPGRGLALDGRVELPPDAHVDATAASATLKENGTLQVRVPKVEPAPGTGSEAVEVSEEGDDGAEAAEPDEEEDWEASVEENDEFHVAGDDADESDGDVDQSDTDSA